MGLCYDCGFKALTVALALRLPGDCLPLGGPGGTDQHGELAVVEQAERAEQLTADRDRFPYRLWHRHCRLNRIPSASIIVIGLSLARQIMRKHNGTIDLVRSDVNQTVFQLIFR